jgi:hypothetical protein
MVTAPSSRARRARILQRKRGMLGAMLNSRETVERAELAVTEHGVAYLLELAATNARPAALERGVTIVVDRDGVGDEVTVPCDRELALGKLATMLDLATRATPHGGVVRVSCAVDVTEVRYDVSHEGEAAPPRPMMTFRLPRGNELTK